MSEDAAYAAGLFDGEGHVGVMGGNNDRTHQLRVSVSMCDPEPLDFLQERYGGNVQKRIRPGRHRWVFDYYVTGGKAIDLLTDILPHSKGKFRQVVKALEFPHMGYVYGKGRPIPNGVIARRQRVKADLVNLRRARDDV